MPLLAGTKVGPYEIIEPIGAGGMGEVYRARDTTLRRDVALKVLPADFSNNPERMARFQREAEVLASLDHPNIGHIHGVVESDGARALALALIEGPTLADRIAAGPIALEESIAIAKQIVEALEYAHERGVIHRDLKPANIKINPDGVVKVLDFGLAKVLEDEPPPSSMANSPTLTVGHTRAGVILGTAAYMSPEQAVGRPVDRRSDIFSFGAVLYEMLTGVRAFAGTATPDVLEAVVKNDPDWAKLPAQAAPGIGKLLRRCVVKDRKLRLQAIGEARLVLANPGEEAVPDSAPSRLRLGWAWIAAGVLALIAVGALAGWYRATRPAEQKALVRLNLDLPGYDDRGVTNSDYALSPDGRRVVYRQRGTGGVPMLATRLLAESDTTNLRGTEHATLPFFSPDGQWIGFYSNNQIQKISVRGGAPVALAASPVFLGATWGTDDSIVAALNVGSPLSRIRDTGGAPEEIVSGADAGNAISLLFPQYLRGNKAILFTATDGSAPGIYVKNLAAGKAQRLIENAGAARYLPTGESTGHIVYLNQGTLFARPFNPATFALLGPPQPVLNDVATLSFSETGSFLYRIGQAGKQVWPVHWLDSTGTTRPLLSTEGAYNSPRFSPDPEGRFLALVKGASASGGEVLVYDWKNDVTVSLTGTGKPGGSPVWSPDGKHVAMIQGKDIVWMRSDGAGEPHRILEGKYPSIPGSISPDGRYLAFSEANPDSRLDLWVAPLDLSKPEQPVVGKPELVLRNPGNDFFPVFSPDGKWLAYFSDESGRYEVYVRPFPGPGAARNISGNGGVYPAWSSNGHELLFDGLGGIAVVDYHVTGDAFVASRPRVWSNARLRSVGSFSSWALHPDGKHIAMFPVDAPDEENAGGPRFGFLLNFFDEVRRLAPAYVK